MLYYGVFLAVGSYTLHEGDDLREAIRRADENMYHDKDEQRKNRPDEIDADRSYVR